MLLLFEDDENDVHGDKCCLLESLKTMSHFHSKRMHRVHVQSSTSPERREPPSNVKKNIAVLKRALSGRHGGWAKRDWRSKSRPQWQGRLWKKLHRVLSIVGRIPKIEESGRRFLVNSITGFCP